MVRERLSENTHMGALTSPPTFLASLMSWLFPKSPVQEKMMSRLEKQVSALATGSAGHHLS